MFTLDLNGHSITGANGCDVITVSAGTLTLKDSGTGGKIKHAENTSGRGVSVSENAGFTMEGGTITGNTVSSEGGGVFVAGRFNMVRGTISDNEAGFCGGGVYNDGFFSMQGGSISNNKASVSGNVTNHGGGVYNDGSFTMSGGSITGNTADNNGGGVYNVETFTMSGGEITGNHAIGENTSPGFECGGVFQTGTFKISGTPRITGNTALQSNKAANVCVYQSDVGTYKITVDDALGTASTGVTTDENTRVFTTGGSLTSDQARSVFTSDVNTYEVYAVNGQAAVSEHVFSGRLYVGDAEVMSYGDVEGTGASGTAT